MKKYTCHCCGYKTLEKKPTGTFEICEVCYWEDDHIQSENPYEVGGANAVSLFKAQQNFLKFNASESIFVDSVRKPTIKEMKDSNFQLLPPPVQDFFF